MEQDSGIEYDEELETTDPIETDSDLGDAVKDGTSNTFAPGGDGR